LKPIALLAHQDVVPVEPGTEDRWTHPPFGGVIDDGMVWGRGALDNKGQLIAIMEAVDRLAASGFQPARDIYLLFGHDEELGGEEGAKIIAETLTQRGVTLAMTLDEGSGVVDNLIPGAARPLALIATAEKGSVTLRFTARAEGGHSSAPAKDTAVSLVSRAVVAVTDNPHPVKIDRNVVDFLHGIAPETPFMQRLMLSNLWITGSLVKSRLADNPTTAASLHTTTAPTIISGGVKLNVLPQSASAMVNYRIHPRDSVEDVVSRARNSINDERVTIEVLSASEPSPRASQTGDEYRAIEESVADVFGSISIAPSLTLQGTDTKHFTEIADNNYRFTPFIYEPDDLKRMHGDDERIRIIDLARGAAWYEDFLKRAAGEPGD
jgi:carboxypeptidase PM20D1